MLLPDVIKRFVRVYPLAEWNRQEALLAEQNEFDELDAMVRRLALGDCADCDVDKLGRVLIPTAIRERAGIERDVVWIGVGKSIELWDKKRHQEMRDEVFGNADRLREVVAHMSSLRPR